VFLDATYCKARIGRRVVSQAVVVAIGVAADGRREVLGFEVGDTESQPFWTTFLPNASTNSSATSNGTDTTNPPSTRARARPRTLRTAPGGAHPDGARCLSEK
jgi:hypothetical protein